MSEKPTVIPNAADEKQVKEASIKVRRGRQQELEDLAFILGEKRGRRVMHRILNHVRTFRTPFDPHGSISNFNMGEQNVGFWLLAEIDEAAPDLYDLMRREAKEERS